MSDIWTFFGVDLGPDNGSKNDQTNQEVKEGNLDKIRLKNLKV